ncbi:tetratricopeptide repeat protein [Pontibacillus litoralis]|uniref:Uncharacterized protein n=1 Tax=Pontibacillus litoralis JSM 072002 TaxID=1385512 RepID=A0A0A5G260_9BACI|nr:hypothetical protein [Pontibacillus litoralis]KGX86114.1 hypothetical protein N784_06000 [Pontibacillus litoralis JSM 072002]
MFQTQLTVKEQKQKKTFNIHQMLVYKQGKIIELSDAEQQQYYMFFYKNKYLNMVKAKRMKPESFIANAYEDGICFKCPHPFIDTLLSETTHYTIHRFNDLFPKLQHQHTNQETALIATFFESFIKKEQLVKYIKTLFYEDRRAGKMFACNRIYRLLETFAPQHTWVRSLAGDLEFKKFDPLYEKMNADLFQRDPIYIESALYDQRHSPSSYEQLSKLFLKQERWLDELVLSIDQLEANQAPELYTHVSEQIHHHYSGQAIMYILEDIHTRIALPQLKHDLFDTFVKLDEPEKALALIATHKLTLSEKQRHAFHAIIEHIDFNKSSLSIEQLNDVIASLFSIVPIQAESLLSKAITLLIKEHPLSYIQKWLTPMRDLDKAQSIVNKIDQMQLLQEDPNKQGQLGELYYEFQQLDEAIECFSFEMELDEHNPKPVQKLAKLYKELGKEHEAKAYQQLYTDMVKRA